MKKINPLVLFLILIIFFLIVGPLVMPLPPLDGIKPMSELVYPDSQFMDINDVSIHFQEQVSENNNDTLILLLHGFGSSTYSWQNVMEPLSAFGTVLAYDRPGFGLTERIIPSGNKSFNPYSLNYQSEIINQIIEEKNPSKVILVGNSAGGPVAIKSALEYPEKIDGLILISPAVYGGGGAPRWIRPFLNLPQMDRLGPVFVRTIRERGLEILELAWYDPTKISQKDLDNYQKPLSVENWDVALWEFTKANGDNDLSSQIQNLKLPVIVITGEGDKIIPTDQSIKVASELSNAEYFSIPNCGHVPQEECPSELTEIIDNFLVDIYKD